MLAGIDDPWQIGARLLDEGPSAVVVKQGKSGAVAVSGPGMLQVPAFGVPVVDTTCAGDAFAAGFLFALVEGWTLEAAVKFANATGALSVTQFSHQGITSLSAVHEFLQERLGETAASRLFFRAKGSNS